MKKIIYIILAVTLFVSFTILAYSLVTKPEDQNPVLTNTDKTSPSQTNTNTTTQNDQQYNQELQLANPASQYCVDKGGKVEIRNTEKGQSGYCIFEDNSECEEWAFYKGECNQGSNPSVDKEKDAKEIQAVLVKLRGPSINQSAVILNYDDGTYASGSIMPKGDAQVGGAFVYAQKVNGSWEIVADGNGMITCAQLEPYSDFPSELIPECIDENGNPQKR